MTERFLRDYRLTVGLGSQAVTVLPPFRIAFSVDKSDKSDLNKATIKVYGLNPDKRKRLVRDGLRDGHFPVQLDVGYQGKLETIFRGSVDLAGSTREGADFITTMECLDGGSDFLFSFVSAAVIGKQAAFDAILESMPNTAKGKIGAMGELTRPKVMVGNSMAVANEMLDPGQRMFIDNERLNVLKNDEVVSSFVPVIVSESGLLNTPTTEKREDPKKKKEDDDGEKKKKKSTSPKEEKTKNDITVTTMLNPAVKVGGLFKLVSVTAPHTNGIYKCTLITYSGDTDGNDWIMTIAGVIAQNYMVPR